jgi:hypothetical protein
MQELEKSSQESSSLFNLTIEAFEELTKVGMDLNSLFVLECLSEGTDPCVHVKSYNCERVEAWKQGLIRKGLVNEDLTLTLNGKQLLSSSHKGTSVFEGFKAVAIKKTDDFERWWSTFPKTDLFEYGGKYFSGSRGMRVRKDDCRKKLLKILDEGPYTIEDMIRALEYEILLKKKESLKENANKLKYMHNSFTYLNQRDFENFIEISKSEKAHNNTEQGTFNI